MLARAAASSCPEPSRCGICHSTGAPASPSATASDACLDRRPGALAQRVVIRPRAVALVERDQPLVDQLRGVAAELAAIRQHAAEAAERHRVVGEREALEQDARVGGQAGQRGAQRRADLDGTGAGAIAERVAREELQEERVASALAQRARDRRVGQRALRGVGGEQRAGGGAVERAQRDPDEPGEPGLALGPRQRDRPAAEHHAQPGGAGAGDRRLQEQQAVVVGPLQVVDPQHDRPDAGQPAQDGGEPELGLAARLHAVAGQLAGVARRGQGAEHRKRPDQRARHAAGERRAIGVRQLRDRAGEVVDQRVDRAQRHRLVRPRRALEHEAARRALAGQERAHQRRLPDPGLALDDHDRGPPTRRAGQRRGEPGELGVAAEQLDARAVRGLVVRRLTGQRRGDRPPPGAPAGIGVEQAPRQIAELARGRRELAHRREPPQLLAQQDLGDVAPARRDPAGEQLVQHGAEAVPVRRRARRPALEQLGRGVGQRPRRAGGQRGEPEVDHPDVAALRDQDVRRLEIAVQDATRMQLADRRRDPAEHAAELVAAGAARVLAQAHAAHQLHREERRAVVDREIEEPDQPGRVDVGERAELRLDLDQRVERGRAEPLERDGRTEREVDRLVDLAARPAPQAPHEAVSIGEHLRIARRRCHSTDS
jgi:hypothetical protein